MELILILSNPDVYVSQPMTIGELEDLSHEMEDRGITEHEQDLIIKRLVAMAKENLS